jgi:hypothetical protein
LSLLLNCKGSLYFGYPYIWLQIFSLSLNVNFPSLWLKTKTWEKQFKKRKDLFLLIVSWFHCHRLSGGRTSWLWEHMAKKAAHSMVARFRERARRGPGTKYTLPGYAPISPLPPMILYPPPWSFHCFPNNAIKLWAPQWINPLMRSDSFTKASPAFGTEPSTQEPFGDISDPKHNTWIVFTCLVVSLKHKSFLTFMKSYFFWCFWCHSS